VALAKSRSQRSKKEQHGVDRGLARSVVLELLVFVPASATLVCLLAPALARGDVIGNPVLSNPIYAVLGIASYGFPFATVRRIVQRCALKAIQEFAEITKEATEDNGEE
jgi:hypothetical protein